MNAIITIDASDGIAFHEADPGYWIVTIDGDEQDTRTITRDGSGFIAWLGFQSRHWSFGKALKACADDARYRRARYEDQRHANDEAAASVMRMTPEQKARVIETLEERSARLEYAPAHIDIAARRAEIARKIAFLREPA
jgi:hypothetical protein